MSPRWVRRKALLPMLPIVGVIVVFAVMAWQYRWMSDDGLIHLRVVRQIQAGHGPVFNPGARVEVTTSIAWVAALVVLDLLIPAPLEWIAVITGIALALVGLGLLAAGAVRLQRSPAGRRPEPRWPGSVSALGKPGTERVVWLPLGLGVMAALAPAWHMASAGLENGLAWAWLGGCWYGLVRTLTGDDPVPLDTGARAAGSTDAVNPSVVTRGRLWLSTMVGLGLLIRPDLVVFVGAWLLLLLIPAWRHRGWRGAAAILAAAGAIPAAYQVFRMGYFGLMVPNTAITKEASRLLPSRGWDFLVDQMGDHFLWLGLLTLAVAAVPFLSRLDGNRLRVATVTMGAGALSLVYIVAIGGDFMGSRLLLIPILGLAAPVAAVPVPLGGAPALRPTAVALVPVVVWMLVAGFWLREGDDNFDMMAQQNTVLAKEVPIRPDPADGEPGVFYGPDALPGAEPEAGLGPSVFSGLAIGLPSFRADADTTVIDLLGLGEPVVSHFKLEERGKLAGHEKTMPVWWFLARGTAPGSEARVDPNLETMEPFYTGDFGPEPSGTLEERTVMTRAAMRCEPVAVLIAAAEAPLDARRFVTNLRGAPARTLRRIPVNPEEMLNLSGDQPQCRDAT